MAGDKGGLGKRVWTAEEIEADFAERAEGLRQVEAEVLGCPRCKLAQTRTHAVPGEGSYRSVVLFVGEGPGQEEDRQGRPFVGRSGQLLTRNLARLGIDRKDVFITNVVKCRPPDNRDPESDEIAACADYLTRQIALINPRIIVTLGRISMSRFFPGAKISQVHGQVKNIGGGRVALAMFHPAAALRSPQVMDQFEQDFARLPGLIERARRANESAWRGESLPAGVPHPGDPDYAGDAAQPANLTGSAAGTSAGQGDPSAAEAAAPAPGPGPTPEQRRQAGTAASTAADSGADDQGRADSTSSQLSLF
jgi:DNA polymerase